NARAFSKSVVGTNATMSVVPSMDTRWALSVGRAFTTMTRGVEKATGRRHRLWRAARSGHADGARFSGRSSDPEASASRASTDLRLPRCHDRDDGRRNVDRSAAPRSLDSGGYSP